jgi:hypothetical protein
MVFDHFKQILNFLLEIDMMFHVLIVEVVLDINNQVDRRLVENGCFDEVLIQQG